jgi:hypothetical protein
MKAYVPSTPDPIPDSVITFDVPETLSVTFTSQALKNAEGLRTLASFVEDRYGQKGLSSTST